MADGLIFLLVLTLIPGLLAQDICDECTCQSSGLNGAVQDFTACVGKFWQYISDKPYDFLPVTTQLVIADSPVEELLNPEIEFSGFADSQITDLGLINTAVRFIPMDYFRHPKFSALKYLRMDRCLLEDMADVLFKVGQAPSLNELVLADNPFATISREMFLLNSLNTKLIGLNIGDCSFDVPEDLFDDFGGYQLIDLALHGLPISTNHTFLERLFEQIIAQVVRLDLSNTGMESVPEFMGQMTALRELILNDNRIATIEPPILDPIRCYQLADGYTAGIHGLFNDELEILSMESNQIEIIDTKHLPRTLTTLILAYNRITDVRTGFSTTQTSLEFLDLKYNLIAMVTTQTFSFTTNPSLSYINLKGNRLSSIARPLLENYQAASVNPANIFKLYLSENPFHCDCGLAPLLDHIFYDPEVDEHYGEYQSIVCYLSDGSPFNVHDNVVGPTDMTPYEDSSGCQADTYCQLFDGDKYNCSYRNLPIIPLGFVDTPWLLDLSHNAIYDITNSFLADADAAAITILDLSHNYIGPDLFTLQFTGLNQLQELDLSHNKISEIRAWTFRDNLRLYKLDLSHNQIQSTCHVTTGDGLGSRFYPLVLSNTQIDLSYNEIAEDGCNSFSLYLSSDPSLPVSIPNEVTWLSLDLSHNCIDLAVPTITTQDFYKPPEAAYEGFGVKSITGALNYSDNEILNAESVIRIAFGTLDCVGQLDLSSNDIGTISRNLIYEADGLVDKWSQCGAQLLLGDNPYLCDCIRQLPFWVYYNQSTAGELSYIDFTSTLMCASPEERLAKLIYDQPYPRCACTQGDECFVHTDPQYYAECREVEFTNPPEFTCGPCPPGFSGDGVSCIVVDPCVNSPCFIHPDDPSLASSCTQTDVDDFSCGSCPAGMTGDGIGQQGCQDIDMCQIYGCYQDPSNNISLTCFDLPPPSVFISCEACPLGLQSVINGINCNVAGQCCEDDNPCLDPVTNYCFTPTSCVNRVFPETGIECGNCPHGTKDLDLSAPGRYCVEIDGCRDDQCYDAEPNPATCTDVLYTDLEPSDDANLVVCTCAPGMTGIGLGVHGCHDLDGCVNNQCWSSTSLGVNAECEDVVAYPGMADPLEYTCTCPAGTEGDGLSCSDTNPCSGSTNPCFDQTSCSVVTPPLDDVTCGPCPQGYEGDGFKCVDRDECSLSDFVPACYPGLSCVPQPAPYTGDDYRCLGSCPCGTARHNGGKGSDGCQEVDLCKHSPCSIESSCRYAPTNEGSTVTCGECEEGTIAVPDCEIPGSKACCYSPGMFPLRLKRDAVNQGAGNMYSSGLLQTYYNGEWRDVAFPDLTSPADYALYAGLTANAACRAMGYTFGTIVDEDWILSDSAGDAWTSVLCRYEGLDIKDCDWSAFYEDGGVCTVQTARLYISCRYAVTGFQLLDGIFPNQGTVYATVLTSSESCEHDVLPICETNTIGSTIQKVCNSAGYSSFAISSAPTTMEPGECLHVTDDNVIRIDSQTVSRIVLSVNCYIEEESFRLYGEAGFLQMRVGGSDWAYLTVDYLDNDPFFKDLAQWNRMCERLGFYPHLEYLRVETVSNEPVCNFWSGFPSANTISTRDCQAAGIRVKCATSDYELRIVDSLQRPATRGRVEVKTSGGVWNTLVVQDYSYVTPALASVVCRDVDYLGAFWWLNDDIPDADIRAEYGSSAGQGRVKLMSNFICRGGENRLPDCVNDGTAVDDMIGQWYPVDSAEGYPLVVECADSLLVELTSGHYGGVTYFNGEHWGAVCVDSDVVCQTVDVNGDGIPTSQLPTVVCRHLGYTSGYAIEPTEAYVESIELGDVVLGTECYGDSLLNCPREIRPCDPSSGDRLLAVRCYDWFNACNAEANDCFDNESCVDLLDGEDKICSCPLGYEGNGYDCVDVDECSPENNPCFEPESCVPATPIPGLRAAPIATCSACPQGTVDALPTQPGRLCLEQNSCLPNLCSDPTSCEDVLLSPDSTDGYTCGACSPGYVPSTSEECLDGTKVAGSKECCVDGNGCTGYPCGLDKPCYDLPAPAPVIGDGSYTCGDCPSGSVLNDVNGRCENIDYCTPELNPCDENAFCEDLPPPANTARCQCHAGYLQNTTGVRGKCPEVDLCAAEPGVCGVGRTCQDIEPPADQSLLDAPATTCSACPNGYKPSAGFSITLPEYEAARLNGGSVARDCIEFDACVELPLQGIETCYKFPGSSTYDVECIDRTGEITSGPMFSCGTCPPGMTGTGRGQSGCYNINSCSSNPCDASALRCEDLLPPQNGFNCICPGGTVGSGPGNSKCLNYNACEGGDNRCTFPDRCVDLPYTAYRPYYCTCPKGMYLATEYACGDIDGCIGFPCYGGCTDVDYNDPIIVLNPFTDGSDFICDPCPRGMVGNAIGANGCKELDLCSNSPDRSQLCYRAQSGLSALCLDVPHTQLTATDPEDLYRCLCPPGMTGDGFGQAGCTEIDYCAQTICPANTVCVDYPPPSNGGNCECAAGYSGRPCQDHNYCTLLQTLCGAVRSCEDLTPPADPFSYFHPVVKCSECPVGSRGGPEVLYLRDGVIDEVSSCEEIDGCELKNTCWVNPLTGTSICEDVPASELRPWNTGYEIRCGACPYGMVGDGDTRNGQAGCRDINGCELNSCYVGVKCHDVPWYDLLPWQPADSFTCDPCPGELEGDGKTCYGGCDFDHDLCHGDLQGSTTWYRQVGLLDSLSNGNINEEPQATDPPLFDHSKPFSTKGYFLTVDAHRLAAHKSAVFTLPVVRGPAQVNIRFYYYYSGSSDGALRVRKTEAGGPDEVLFSVTRSSENMEWMSKSVFAWSNEDFKISFEYLRFDHVPATSERQQYVAIDDIYVENLVDWGCYANQTCENANLCMRLPQTTSMGQDYKCYCLPGFYGDRCQYQLNACDRKPCRSGSTCVPVDGIHECICPPNLTGRHCELDVNECETHQVICQYGGSCSNLNGSFVCRCPSGFTGRTCQTNVDNCIAVDCGYGECVDLVDSFKCICKDGWTGPYCNINENQCSTRPCLQGAQCTDDQGPFICHCPAGFTGRVCEHNIDDCIGVMCRHGSSCVDLVNDYECDCPPGYDGKKCERDIAECEGNPCNGHGKCYEGIDNSDCLCYTPGCREHLDCSYKPAKYLCQCDAGYTGMNCETAIDYCAANPCKHGRCIADADYYHCQCEPGWTGSNCESNINECIGYPCKNQGRCYDLVDGYACYCQPGFSGKDCQINVNECLLHLCENGATCRDLVNDYECVCPPYYVGEFCELRVVEYRQKNTSDLSTGRTQAVIALPPSSDSCTRWDHLGKTLKFEVVGYTVLAMVLSILLLLAFAMCRMSGIGKVDDYFPGGTAVGPVTRYVQHLPFHGGNYQMMPQHYAKSQHSGRSGSRLVGSSGNSSSGDTRSPRSRRSRESRTHRDFQPGMRAVYDNRGYVPYFY